MAYQLTPLGVIRLQSQPTRLALSDQGDYLVVRTQSGELLYYNSRQELLWSGQAHSTVSKMAVSSDRQHVAINQTIDNTPITYAFNKDGNLIWNFTSNDWTVHDLYLNGSQPIIAASNKRQAANLGSEGNVVWIHPTSENVKSMAIGMNGDTVVFATDKAIGCLDTKGNLRWRVPVNNPIVHLHIGLDRIVGADRQGKVYCLDVDNGETLVVHDLNEDIHGLVISGSGKFLVIATGHALNVTRLEPRTGLSILPIPEERTGIASVLGDFAPDEIHDLHLSPNRDCMIVEQESAYACYTLEGDLLWHCDKIDPKKIIEPDEPEVVPPPPPPPPDPSDVLKSEFIEYTQQKSVYKSEKLKTRTNIVIGADILDVYYDGRGYLFVHKATNQTLSKAERLAKKTNIFIVTYHASDEIVQDVKDTKSVEIFLLNDMVKTAGGGLFGSKNEFESFAKTEHGLQFQNI